MWTCRDCIQSGGAPGIDLIGGGADLFYSRLLQCIRRLDPLRPIDYWRPSARVIVSLWPLNNFRMADGHNANQHKQQQPHTSISLTRIRLRSATPRPSVEAYLTC